MITNMNEQVYKEIAVLIRHMETNNFSELLPLAVQHYSSNDVIQYLIDICIDINFEDKTGGTALIWASYKDILSVVKFLIERGANVNYQNCFGDTAIIYTVNRDHRKIFTTLLENNADPYLKNNDGVSVKYFAKENKCGEVLKDWELKKSLSDTSSFVTSPTPTRII